MMRVIRILTLTVLFLAGIGLILYGSICHVVTVEEDKTREISIAVPTLPGFEESHGGPPGAMPGEPPWGGDATGGDVDPFRGDGPQASGENPFENHAMMPSPPGIKYETITESYVEAQEEPEWAIVREVTFGGLVLAANGQLKRTYTGQPPSLCPS